MTDQEFQRLARDPEYFLTNQAAIARGERPADIRTPKPREFISRGDKNFHEVMIKRTDDIASGRLVVL